MPPNVVTSILSTSFPIFLLLLSSYLAFFNMFVPLTIFSLIASTSAATIPRSGGQWVDKGCFFDNQPKHVLDAAPKTSAKMTPAKCQSTCSGYRFAGLENGDECYCSNVLTTYSYIPVWGDCVTPCAGNSTQYCGGSSNVEIFEALDKQTDPSSTYQPLGCYKNSGNILPVSGGAPPSEWGWLPSTCNAR